ncbi:pitrilysin family protein [Brevundimonas sp.]|uniref:M16 family metallopeptidase n=1 Tax=Brevundimonas sp. TaxID=1871086 RepID=UPI0022C52891|nr:pitrilysin family protein [Brevundimonas sp.]MCZ8194967.1 pitrilysin family protein [Brevundimonas sp.]
MPGLQTFALTLAVAGGARFEDPARSGWSHFLEHLVFKGAGAMSARDIVERIEGEGGTINAATGYERTSFEVRAPASCLALAVEVVADLVRRPTLDPAEIAREKDVVAQEIAEAFDTPDDHVFEMAQGRAFAGQSLGRPILGTVESLAPVDAAGLRDWAERLYSPDRMVLAVSGAVAETELLRLAEAAFGDAAPRPATSASPARFDGGAATLSRRIEQANLVFQLPAADAHDPILPAQRLFVEVLGGGMASRLFQSAREERGLAYSIDAYGETYEDAGVLGVYAGAAAERAEELAALCAAEISALAEHGPTDAELSRAKAVLAAGLFMADESPAARAGRLAAQTLIYGAPIPTTSAEARLRAASAAEVAGAGRRLLVPGRAAAAVLGPRRAAPAGQAFVAMLFAAA